MNRARLKLVRLASAVGHAEVAGGNSPKAGACRGPSKPHGFPARPAPGSPAAWASRSTGLGARQRGPAGWGRWPWKQSAERLDAAACGAAP